MVLESVGIGKSPVTGVTLVGFVLAGGRQQSVILLLADHPHYLPVSRGQGDRLGLHHLLHLLDVLGEGRVTSQSSQHPLLTMPCSSTLTMS